MDEGGRCFDNAPKCLKGDGGADCYRYVLS